MREIISFFIRNGKWWIFLACVIASCTMLFKGNPYQHHVYITSANAVSSSVYGVASNISSYFNLRETNDDLNRRNAELQTEVEELRQRLLQMQDHLGKDTALLPAAVRKFEFVTAHVINNSVSHPNNFITINKGRLDGVDKEMGVIDQNGVVGVVDNASDHSARVISLLNPKFRLSCKLQGSENFGSLVWDGNDPSVAVLEDLPRHTEYHDGDTVVTNGYSALFPSGIPVGTVVPGQKPETTNAISLKIKLATDFTTLSNVQVVQNYLREEIKSVEKE